MHTDPNGLRYVLYARKSSESEDRQMASVEDQVTEMQRFAEERGLNVTSVVRESRSAKDIGRPHFNRMLNAIRDGEADAILCWKLNRLARNPIDGGQVIDLLQKNIVKHIQTSGRDYRPTDNVIMMYVEFGMSNQFSNDLSADVKRGMRMKAERGWNPSRSLPIGYVHNKDRNGKVLEEEIAPDPVRFPIVRKLWKKMLKGHYSVADMKRTGDKLGLCNEKKRPYGLNTYHNIFNSKFYCGYFNWRDSDGERREYKGGHKRMISELEFEKVQRILGNRSNPTRVRRYEFPFKGFLRCGECGCNITAERKLNTRCRSCKKKFSCINRDDCPHCRTNISDMEDPHITNIIYYRCTKKKGSCEQKGITQEALRAHYMGLAKEFQINKDYHHLLMEELKTVNQKQLDQRDGFLNSQRQQLSELENRLGSLALMRADGELTKQEFLSIRTETQHKVDEKRRLIKEHEYERLEWQEMRQKLADFGLRAVKIFKNGKNEKIREMLDTLGSNQLLMDKRLYITRRKELMKLQRGYKVYTAQKVGFEPQDPLILKGDSTDSDL